MRRIRDLPFEKPNYSPVLNFDGIDDYVNVGTDSSLSITDNLSVFCSIQSLNFTPSIELPIIAKMGSNNSTRGWWISHLTNTNVFSVAVSQDGSFITNLSKQYDSSITTIDGKTNIIGFTFGGGTLNLYINGNIDPNPIKTIDNAITSIFDNSTISLRIGRYTGSVGFYKGLINWVGIWNVLLTPTQIKAMALGQNISTGCVLFHNYNLGNLNNLSGNNNNGTAIGANFIRQLAGYEKIDPKVKK